MGLSAGDHECDEAHGGKRGGRAPSDLGVFGKGRQSLSCFGSDELLAQRAGSGCVHVRPRAIACASKSEDGAIGPAVCGEG